MSAVRDGCELTAETQSKGESGVALIRARQLLREKRFAEAEQLCLERCMRGVVEARLHVLLAHAQLGQRQYQDAARQAEKALRLEPAEAEAYRILADVSSIRGDLDGARQRLESVLALQPNDLHCRALLQMLSSTPDGTPITARAASLEAFLDFCDDASAPAFDVSDSMMEMLRPSAAVGSATDAGTRRIVGSHADLPTAANTPAIEPVDGSDSLDLIEPLEALDSIEEIHSIDPIEDTPSPRAEGLAPEDAPTFSAHPALRDSARRLHLDPIADEPVQQHDEFGALTESRGTRQLTNPGAQATGPAFGPSLDELEIEPASIPDARAPAKDGPYDPSLSALRAPSPRVADRADQAPLLRTPSASLTEPRSRRELPASGRSAHPASPFSRRRRRRWPWVALLLLLAGGSGFGYYRYRLYSFTQARWREVRRGFASSTLAGLQSAHKATEKILARQDNNPLALAALAACNAALAIDFGEPRLDAAEQQVKQVSARDSAWRTVAEGYLGLLRDPKQAAGYLRKGTEVYPKSALIHYLHGRALGQVNDDEQAQRSLERALKLRPDFVAARVALATLLGAEDFPDGARRLDQILRQHPNHRLALIARARLALHHRKDLKLARQQAQYVVKNPADQAGTRQVGWGHLLLASIDRAESESAAIDAAVDAALDAAPCCDTQFRFELAGALLSLHRYRDALRQISAALKFRSRHPAYLYRAARISLALRQPLHAEQMLMRAPKDSAETALLRGRVALQRGSAKLAQQHLRRALTLMPGDVETSIALAVAQGQTGQRAAGIARLRRLLRRGQRRAEIFLALAEMYRMANDDAAAAIQLSQAAKHDPFDPRIPTMRAQIVRAAGGTAQAESLLHAALKLRSDYLPARVLLAELKLDAGAVEDARNQAAQMHEADRNSPLYLLLEARIALARDQLDQTSAHLSAAEAAGAEAKQLDLLRGRLALARNDAKGAVEFLQSARRAGAREILPLLGHALARAQRLDAAYELLQKALKSDAEDPLTLLELGRIAVADGELKLALQHLTTAVKTMASRRPSVRLRAEIHAALASAYLQKDDTGRALTNLQDAIDIDPSLAEPHYRMGQTYARLDRPKRAAPHFEQALKLDAQLTDAHLGAARAYSKLKNSALAIKHLRLFLSKAPAADKRRTEAQRLLKQLGG